MIRCFIILLCCITINSTVFAFVENEKENAPRPSHFRRDRERAAVGSPHSFNIQSDLLTKRQQLILGIVILNQRFHTFREEGYAHFLRELLRITEFTNEEAVKIINQYAGRPDKWQAFLQEIRETLLSAGAENDE